MWDKVGGVSLAIGGNICATHIFVSQMLQIGKGDLLDVGFEDEGFHGVKIILWILQYLPTDYLFCSFYNTQQ